MGLAKCILTILELNWYERLGDKKKNLKFVKYLCRAHDLQNIILRVWWEENDCNMYKNGPENARTKRSKLLFSIVEYPNLWRSCPPCPSGWLSSQIVITAVTWDGVRGEHFSHVCSECSLWNLFAGNYLSQQLPCVAFLAVSFTNEDFSKFKQKVVMITVTSDRVRSEHFPHVCSECSLWNLFAGDYLSQGLSYVAFLAVSFTKDDLSKFKQKVVIITVTSDRVKSEHFPHVCSECSLWIYLLVIICLGDCHMLLF